MATQKFDKLNNIRKQSIPFEKYFGEMDLEDSEKTKRIGLANELDEMFYFFLDLLFDDYDSEKAKEEMKEQYMNIVSTRFNDVIRDSDKMNEYINAIVDEIVDTTVKSIADEWFTSQDRATYLAEEETNSVGNYYMDLQAIIDGKTEKTWRTILDGRERQTHHEAHNQTVKIDEAFLVGGYRMMYPRDTSLGAPLTEICGCRCSVFYS